MNPVILIYKFLFSFSKETPGLALLRGSPLVRLTDSQVEMDHAHKPAFKNGKLATWWGWAHIESNEVNNYIKY